MPEAFRRPEKLGVGSVFDLRRGPADPGDVFLRLAAGAEKRLAHFVVRNLSRYARHRNHPSERATSQFSPHLPFGQIFPLTIALAVQRCAQQHRFTADEFHEQLIVRRELAFDFPRHTARVDSLDELPEWARRTLARHAGDARPQTYSYRRLLHAETADDLWNAAQKELLLTGKMHGYHQMYWGKKIIK